MGVKGKEIRKSEFLTKNQYRSPITYMLFVIINILQILIEISESLYCYPCRIKTSEIHHLQLKGVFAKLKGGIG